MRPTDFRKYCIINLKVIYLLIKLETNVFFKTRATLVAQMLSPLIYFIFIVTALSRTVGNINFLGIEVGYKEYALLGLISMSIIGQMSRLIYRMTVDRRYGFFALKMQNGLHPLAYILVVSTSSILGYLIQSAVFGILVLIFNLKLTLLNFILVIFIGLISMIFWLSVGTLLTIGINSYQTRDLLLTFLIMPLSFSAPSFYVLVDAPFFIQILATINPLTYQLQAIREVAFSIFNWQSLGLMCSFSLISLYLAVHFISKADLTSKELT